MFRVDYNQWPLVAAYILILGVFLYGILRPRRRVEWRSAGVAQAFVIALYAEMYGLPLTMYLVAWLTGRTEFAQDHFHGHAWAFLLGWGETGAIVFDILGQLLIVCGALLALVGTAQAGIIYDIQTGLVPGFGNFQEVLKRIRASIRESDRHSCLLIAILAQLRAHTLKGCNNKPPSITMSAPVM